MDIKSKLVSGKILIIFHLRYQQRQQGGASKRSMWCNKSLNGMCIIDIANTFNRKIQNTEFFSRSTFQAKQQLPNAHVLHNNYRVQYHSNSIILQENAF